MQKQKTKNYTIINFKELPIIVNEIVDSMRDKGLELQEQIFIIKTILSELKMIKRLMKENIVKGTMDKFEINNIMKKLKTNSVKKPLYTG